ncbi:MAG: DUF21 domain-containing protein, partial [Firmicutes bacterium]|nr:DUF21 domain-containing protein [Bacillota bacterium]
MMQYIGIVILILLSAFFSGSEIAFASSSEMKLRKASEDRPTPVSRATYDIFSRYDDALISILIGNNLVNIGSSAVATVIAISLMGDSGAPVATAIMTVIIVIFGEITPKILASRAPEKFSAWVAIPLRFIMIVTFPVAWIVKKMLALLSGLWKGSATDDAVTEDDLETMLDTAEDEGIVDEDTHDLLQSALDFDDCLAYEIITPRVDMTAIDIDDDDETIKNVLLSCPFSRVP